MAIKVTNLATNQIREAQTDAAGSYSMPFLATGDYLVIATH
ncbi:MAG: carboxypeptidase-like regulatory domain-containing protein [Acidobacteriota bacterium]|nr:carboxypeptidase-like regulatory domain-containing protein [Acidobacteriota bacterium]